MNWGQPGTGFQGQWPVLRLDKGRTEEPPWNQPQNSLGGKGVSMDFSSSMWGSTYLIFGGGGRPLTHAAWVMGHLNLTLHISLIHSFVLSKKPIKQRKKIQPLLFYNIKAYKLSYWQDQILLRNKQGNSPICIYFRAYEEAVRDRKDKDEWIQIRIQSEI